MYSNKTITASYCLIAAGVIIVVIWLFLLLPRGFEAEVNYYKYQTFRIVLPFIGSLCLFTGWLVLHTVREAFEEVSLLRVELSELSKRLERIEKQ